MALVEALMEIVRRPSFWATFVGMMQFLGPVWFAFFAGIVLGWVWRPTWACTTFLGNCKFDFSAPSSPSASVSASASASTSSTVKGFGPSSGWDDDDRASKLRKEESEVVTDEDVQHLCRLVGRKDGGPPWKHVMDRCAHSMSYQAWQRHPETGPPQYCSRTVYEDATPELLRDFFLDDEFRLKWDNMIVHADILQECPTTGGMMVHWVRKFPFFCSDREYIIGRRIWDSGSSYYTITKGVPCESVPRKDKPRRVDLYYSSWFIQAVESRKGDGQSACEVILFHHEDMGIPWEIAKFGVRQGMWGAVKNIERGFRAYQKHRASGACLSHHALMAQINTKLDAGYLNIIEGASGDSSSSETKLVASSSDEEKPKGLNLPKLLIIGGAVAVACSLDRGVLTKTLLFGVARKFGNIGKRGGRAPAPMTN